MFEEIPYDIFSASVLAVYFEKVALKITSALNKAAHLAVL